MEVTASSRCQVSKLTFEQDLGDSLPRHEEQATLGEMARMGMERTATLLATPAMRTKIQLSHLSQINEVGDALRGKAPACF